MALREINNAMLLRQWSVMYNARCKLGSSTLPPLSSLHRSAEWHEGNCGQIYENYTILRSWTGT